MDGLPSVILIRAKPLSFSMSHGHSLVNQQLTLDTVALGTLGARTSILLNSQFQTPTASFLAKRIRYFVQMVGRTAADDGPIIIGCANGDATQSEVAAAMNERNMNGPDDVTSMLDQDTAWTVYQSTIAVVVPGAELTEGMVSSGWKKFGKNGIPLIEGSGLMLFAYNAGSAALTTGVTLNGIVQIQGVWLRD